MIHHKLDNGFEPNRWQAIICTNVEQDLCHHNMSPGHNELQYIHLII